MSDPVPTDAQPALGVVRMRTRDAEAEQDGPPAKRARVDAPGLTGDMLAQDAETTATPVLQAGVGPFSSSAPGTLAGPAAGAAAADAGATLPSALGPPAPAPEQRYSTETLHPPSLALLLGVVRPPREPEPARETDVGITEYLSRGVATIEGIIKQRFTDFLVYEVDLQGTVMHVTDIGPPKTAAVEAAEPASTDAQPAASGDADGAGSVTEPPTEPAAAAAAAEKPATYEWTEETAQKLAAYFAGDSLERLEAMYKEGRHPPRVPDQGWGARKGKEVEEAVDEPAVDGVDVTEAPEDGAPEPEAAPGEEVKEEAGEEQKPDRRDRRGRDRGGRGGRDRGRGRGGASRGGKRGDTRQVLSDPITSKEDRGNLHKSIRELFGGQLETETVESKAKGEGSQIVVKWNHSPRGGGQRGRGGARGGRGGREGRGGDRGERESAGQYIHFTLQKTNRDSHDALGYLARMLHCTPKDLMIAGTKDKRGVTCQRVCLRRFGRTLQDVWRGVNAVGRRRTEQDALTTRGERGVRIADLAYSRGHLDLGMLSGNAFVITLRNVKVDSPETIDRAMTSLKERGFINYYGMQRFGTSPVPTHATGLAILHSDWKKACSLILMLRPGEDPECERARRAWLERKDAAQALVFMPRRVVAERCILEHYRDRGSSNPLDALMTIPRNLRTMYIHAYQSYVWNAMVSERIKRYGFGAPVVGDLVFDVPPSPSKAAGGAEDAMDLDLVEEQAEASAGQWKSGRPARPKVKVLAEADLPSHTIFDVIMPLPGHSITMPGGEFGDLYKKFLEADGLTVDSFTKPQKEFSLVGSYRKIIHMPKHVSWKTMRYTDPDLPLAQTDEDKILGLDEPVVDPNGKFLALQIQLTLGPAAYATMALREVTKTETSSQFQSALTQASEDQLYKGAGDAGDDVGALPAAFPLGIEGEGTGIELEPAGMDVDD